MNNTNSKSSLNDTPLPLVSVVIPCRNEEKTIQSVLTAIKNQDYSGNIEVVLAEAKSTDKTVQKINEWKQNNNLDLRIVTNSMIKIPIGVNMAIHEARGEIIVRMDGHSIPNSCYISEAVTTLLNSKYDIVGGKWIVQPGSTTRVAKTIAIATSHFFGVGDSKYRVSKNIKNGLEVDTVPFGCFRKALWEKVGGFDEEMFINEDYDFNFRVRKSGGLIFLNPKMQCVYLSRPTIKKLVKQYFQYGMWKSKMISKFPKSVRWRHLAPPLFIICLSLCFIIGFFIRELLLLFLIVFFSYLVTSIVVSIFTIRKFKVDFFLLPLIFFVIHITWGSGFIYGLIKAPYRNK